MLCISLNPDILSYILLKDDAENVVEDTGILPIPFTLDRTLFSTNDAVRRLSDLFNALKKKFKHPQTDVCLSLCSNLFSYTFSEEETPVWVDEIRYGSDYASSLMRRNYKIHTDNFTIWYDRAILNKIKEAAHYEGIQLAKITPSILNAYNTVHSIYATDHYNHYSILKWDKKYSEILLLKNECIIGYAGFQKVHDSILLLNKSGIFDKDLLPMLNPDSFNEKVYDYTGPIFHYATQESDPDPLKTFKSYGFCEIINPFTGLEAMGPEQEEISGISETILSMWTESAGFINRS